MSKTEANVRAHVYQSRIDDIDQEIAEFEEEVQIWTARLADPSYNFRAASRAQRQAELEADKIRLQVLRELKGALIVLQQGPAKQPSGPVSDIAAEIVGSLLAHLDDCGPEICCEEDEEMGPDERQALEDVKAALQEMLK